MLIGSICQYEVVAFVTGAPTISSLVKKYPVLGPVILGGLVTHFYLEEKLFDATKAV